MKTPILLWIILTLVLISGKEQATPIGEGTINIYVDGENVKEVNLWNRVTEDRKQVCSLTHGVKVKIWEDSDPYYRVEASNGCKGYCLKGFVKVKIIYKKR